MKTLTLLFATALTAAAVTGTSHATSLGTIQVRSKVVSYADLDLNSSEDAEVLYRRIKSAAHDVCTPPGLFPLGTVQLIRGCAKDAIERALSDVDAPSLEPYRVVKKSSFTPKVAHITVLPKDEQR